MRNDFATKPQEDKAEAFAPKRIISDCVGTLFGRKQESYNKQLLKDLADLKNQGYDVVIASSKPLSVQSLVDTICYREGLPIDFFGKVQDKEKYAGTHVFAVIDDDHSSHSITAYHKAAPDDKEERQRWAFAARAAALQAPGAAPAKP